MRRCLSWHEYDLSQPRELGQRIEARYNALLESGNKPIIVDAGANIGSASLWFARHFPAAAIVAIEPDPDSAAVLRINVASRAVTVIEAAVGSERGHVELTSADASWGVQTLRADTGVRVVTIEDAFAESGGDAPFIVKVDIEGFESDLFARNLKWLDRAYAVIIEPHDWMMPGKRTSGSFQSAMASRPFELFIRGENLIYARI